MKDVKITNNAFIQKFLFGPAAIVMVLAKDNENYKKVTDSLVKSGFSKPQEVDIITSDYVFNNNKEFLGAIDTLLKEQFINVNDAEQLKKAYENNEPPSHEAITPELLDKNHALAGMLSALNNLYGFRNLRETTGVGTVEFSQKNLDYLLKKAPENSVATRRAYELLGDAYFEDQLFQAAVLQYQKAIQIAESLYYKWPQETAFLYQKLGDTFKVLKQYKEALASYQNALTITNDEGYYPTSVKLYEKMALVYDLQGLNDEALAQREEAKNFNHKSKEVFGYAIN